MMMLNMNSNSIKMKEIKVIYNKTIKMKKINSITMNKVNMKLMMEINYNKKTCTMLKEKKKDKTPNGVDLTTKMVLTTKVKN